MTSDALRILDGVMRLADLVQRDMAEPFAGTSLTMSRAALLWVLRSTGPSTQQALATALEVSPRNVTGLVDALETSGHVERAPHPTDRRATLVTLTDLGLDVVQQMVAQREQMADDLVAELASAEKEALGAGLEKLANRYETMLAVRERKDSP
ncbi:DNA-binding MarR family transcriptional regulator [Microbacterium sp. SLBN-154]|uniref:MarR family winged helix-turn-helix transcriptional regulator n=1 Tax=Microbacterium sp. SLBN-154 TaxID=2768458 RepID=UPI0011529CF8|nr:MarR family transcriptional regulator [Microbacterium sp. SLBN-154]TQK18559.1 DNA-binding MarR family transcriptional regulator [Microbacterium sp. SLBN-154]